jgi:hypothetical protein
VCRCENLLSGELPAYKITEDHEFLLADRTRSVPATDYSFLTPTSLVRSASIRYGIIMNTVGN